VQETVEDAYASRAHLVVPQWQLDAGVSTYLQIAAGELDTVTTDAVVWTCFPWPPIRRTPRVEALVLGEPAPIKRREVT
jgi:hypothetical protein